MARQGAETEQAEEAAEQQLEVASAGMAGQADLEL